MTHPVLNMTETSSALPPLGRIPPNVFCAADYEIMARRFIAVPGHAYIAGGCGRDGTLAANRQVFQHREIWPRLLRDLSAGHTRLDLLGHRLPHPVMLAPVAYQQLVHPLAEIETARAAAATDTCMVLSTLSSRTLEEVAQHAGVDRWFQLYFQPTRNATVDLLQRAKSAGYRAIMVTLDTAIKAPSLGALQAGFTMPPDVTAVNLSAYPVPGAKILERGESRIFQGMMSEAPSWDDLAWLLKQTDLPVIVKGVMHPADAQRFQAMGVAAQVVSNHGGRSLDGAPASLIVLPRIRAAVGPDYPLLFDSGIRSGCDIFKALALGADAVMIGRLQVYALAVAGALGVAHMLKLLREEFEVCMAQAGCATLSDIGPAMIFSENSEAGTC